MRREAGKERKQQQCNKVPVHTHNRSPDDPVMKILMEAVGEKKDTAGGKERSKV